MQPAPQNVINNQANNNCACHIDPQSISAELLPAGLVKAMHTPCMAVHSLAPNVHPCPEAACHTNLPSHPACSVRGIRCFWGHRLSTVQAPGQPARSHGGDGGEGPGQAGRSGSCSGRWRASHLRPLRTQAGKHSMVALSLPRLPWLYGLHALHMPVAVWPWLHGACC